MMNRTKRIVLALMLLAIPLLSALPADPVLTSTARAQAQDHSDDRVCPLSDDQTQKSIQAFDKIANVFTKEPRCINCHGAVNPFGADANRTHGGGKLDPIMNTEVDAAGETTQDDEATFEQCRGCHSAFSGKWRIPPATLSFVGKDAFTLCKFEKDFFNFNASDFINHIEHDALIQESFTGRMGLDDFGRTLLRPPYVFARRSIPYPAPPTGVTHRDLIQMAHDWVDAQGGAFQGNLECGCKHPDGISGSYVFVQDSLFRNADGSTQKLDQRQSIQFSFREIDGVQKGRATVTASYRQELTDPSGMHACGNRVESTEPYQYVVDVQANVVKMPDGTVSVSVGPPVGWTPPMMRHVSTCPGVPPFEAQAGLNPRIGGVLRNGVFDDRVDLPLDREAGTGTKYYETHIRQGAQR